MLNKRTCLLAIVVLMIGVSSWAASLWQISTRLSNVGGTLKVDTKPVQTVVGVNVLNNYTTTTRTIPVVVTPNTGYDISKVTIGGVSQTIADPNTFTANFSKASGTNNYFVATFAAEQFQVSATQAPGGTISPASRTVAYGKSTTFTITPLNAATMITAVTGATSVSPALPTSSIVTATVSNVTAASTITATYSTATANAGVDQFVGAGEVTLSGTVAGGTPSWSQVSGPAVTLTGATTLAPTFTPAADGAYVFKLSTMNGSTVLVSDNVSINVSSNVVAQMKSQCNVCHNSAAAAVSAAFGGWSESKHVTNPYEVVTCVNCHGPSTGAMPPDLVAAAAVCAGCHAGPYAPHGGNVTNCVDCHNPHTLAPTVHTVAPAAGHAITGQIAVTNVVVVNNGDTDVVPDGQDNLTVTFNVTRDGAPFEFDGSPALYRAYEYGAATTAYTGTVYTIDPLNNARIGLTVGTQASLASFAGGAYTVNINKTPYNANSTYMFSVTDNGAETMPVATAVGYLGSNPRNVVSNDGCIGCHGLNPFSKEGEHHGANPQGAEACVVCHSVVGSVSRGQAGDRTTAYVHGIHASEQAMHGYDRQFPTKDGVIDFMVSYPSYMTNCAVCHTTPAQLAAVNAKEISYSLCMSCHDAWTNFDHGNTVFGTTDHATFNWNTNCTTCHSGATANTFHNNRVTARGGLLQNGQDLSIAEGAKVNMQITGASRNVNDLSVTWTATYDGNPVDPCATVAALNAPVFGFATANTTTGQAAGGLSILRAYAQGDDFINPGIGTSPGQPVSTNIATTNTTCASNVATTTLTLTAPEIATAATKMRVGIQGRAQVKLAATYDDPTTPAVEAKDVILVRSKSPVVDINVADASSAPARRVITDANNCMNCHVGSLYQHGGNRIDNMELCIMCHNEASSEQSVRVFDGVSATEAYDGKVGMTYGFKSLLHAVHSANENGAITMCYRTNGNYVWTGETTVIPNYPAGDVFADDAVALPPVADDNPALASEVGSGSAALIYGSSGPHGTAGIAYGPDKGIYRAHNLYHPTYPQTLKNCVACHVPGSFGFPNAAISMATTVDVGGTLAPSQAASTGAVYGVQTDDKVMGTSAAACFSCHQGSMAPAAFHGNAGGFAAGSVTGRSAVPAETCAGCHN